MRFKMDFTRLHKCGAKTKSNFGFPCRHIALKNGKCHYHGGKTPIKTGNYSLEKKRVRKAQRSMINDAKNVLAEIEGIVHGKE